MALKIEYVKIDDLQEYERNAREHSQEQIDQLVNSIQEFEFTNPVLIDPTNTLIAGHGRIAAAEQLGMAEVPAIRLGHLTDKQIKALRIADNQLALNASWDMDLLASELSDLDSEDFDIDLLGFDEDFLKSLLPDEDETDVPGGAPQEQPEAIEKVDVIVGPYKFSVKQRDWEKWEAVIRAQAGMDNENVVAELKKRLKL